MRFIAGAVVLIAGWVPVALLAPFDAGEVAIAFLLFFVPCIVAGALIGNWPAVYLGLLSAAIAIPPVLRGDHEDLSPEAAVVLFASVGIPLSCAAIAAGVALRKALGAVDEAQ
jgi:hypothetical protein